MLVVAFSCLIIISEHADPGVDQRETVFEAMVAGRKRDRKPPHDQLNKGGFRKPYPLPKTQFSFHVG